MMNLVKMIFMSSREVHKKDKGLFIIDKFRHSVKNEELIFI